MNNIDYNIINKELSFFGLEIRKNDHIEIIDNNEFVIYKESIENFENTINTKNGIKIYVWNNLIKYTKNNNDHFFEYHIPNQIDYFIKITKDENDKYSDITLLTADTKDEFPIRKLNINSDGFGVEICNKLNPFSNEDDEIKKSIIAKNPRDSYNPILSITSKDNEKESNMIATKFGVTINDVKRINILNDWQYNQLANNIILHNENKSLFIDVAQKMNEQIPGCIDFIKENFEIYNNIMNNNYKLDPIAEVLISEMKEMENSKQKTLAS